MGLFVVAVVVAIVVNVLATRTQASGRQHPQPTVAAAPGMPSAPLAGSVGSGTSVPSVSPAWVTTMAARTGIPATAVLAYARAQLTAPCTIGWTTIAGLGWIESQHGTLGGRRLGADGRSTPPIVGPQLDGGLDHAYGPMQFIPDTWSRYATDGDGDGLADIDDIFDAAKASADYLCADGYDLSTASGWAQAVFSYNHSQQYVNDVYAAAIAYDRRSR